MVIVVSKLLKCGGKRYNSFRIHIPIEHIEALDWNEKTEIIFSSFPKCKVLQVKEVLK